MKRGIINPMVPMQPFAPIEKSGWERLLETLKLTEDEALQEIRMGGVAGAQLRGFIKEMAYRKFIPQKALEAMGMTVNVELRFPIE